MGRSIRENQIALFAIAEGQGGFFTAKQAESAGFDRTNHSYHVRTGKWTREHRGIYRVTQYPAPPEADLILWSLWSRNLEDVPQGVYSHATALRVYDLSDIMPVKIHLTVPQKFRRGAEIPKALVLHRANLSPVDIEEREGFRVTRPLQTLRDLIAEGGLSRDLLNQAFGEARDRGLITEKETRSAGFPAWMWVGMEGKK